MRRWISSTGDDEILFLNHADKSFFDLEPEFDFGKTWCYFELSTPMEKWNELESDGGGTTLALTTYLQNRSSDVLTI